MLILDPYTRNILVCRLYTLCNRFMRNIRSGVINAPITLQMPSYSTTTGATSATTTVTAANNVLPRNSGRATMPMQYLDVSKSDSMYEGYNAYNSKRSYLNINIGGYSPYSLYGQPTTNQYQNL